MPPQTYDAINPDDSITTENSSVELIDVQNGITPPLAKRKREIVWGNVIKFSLLHIYALYGLYCFFFCYPLTWLWGALLFYLGGLGITAGAHRLWSHRAYKAKLPLRIFLAFCNCIAIQNSILDWVKDHRTHHKYSETNADPHNATRGFFFSHVGWLLVKKHPDVIEKGKRLNYDDIYADPVCAIQHKYYLPLIILIGLVIPTIIPGLLWNESYINALFVCVFLRYAINLNATWCVNSVAHIWGNKPYDGNINPSENIWVTLWAIGEGFHNYHHTFPWDYSTSEYGWKLNFTTSFIDIMAKLGQVYDKNKVSKKMLYNKVKRSGDGSHPMAEFLNKMDDESDNSKNTTKIE